MRNKSTVYIEESRSEAHFATSNNFLVKPPPGETRHCEWAGQAPNKKKPAKKKMAILLFFWIYARRDFVLNPDFSGIVVNVHQE